MSLSELLKSWEEQQRTKNGKWLYDLSLAHVETANPTVLGKIRVENQRDLEICNKKLLEYKRYINFYAQFTENDERFKSNLAIGRCVVDWRGQVVAKQNQGESSKKKQVKHEDLDFGSPMHGSLHNGHKSRLFRVPALRIAYFQRILDARKTTFKTTLRNIPSLPNIKRELADIELTLSGIKGLQTQVETREGRQYLEKNKIPGNDNYSLIKDIERAINQIPDMHQKIDQYQNYFATKAPYFPEAIRATSSVEYTAAQIDAKAVEAARKTTRFVTKPGVLIRIAAVAITALGGWALSSLTHNPQPVNQSKPTLTKYQVCEKIRHLKGHIKTMDLDCSSRLNKKPSVKIARVDAVSLTVATTTTNIGTQACEQALTLNHTTMTAYQQSRYATCVRNNHYGINSKKNDEQIRLYTGAYKTGLDQGSGKPVSTALVTEVTKTGIGSQAWMDGLSDANGIKADEAKQDKNKTPGWMANEVYPVERVALAGGLALLGSAALSLVAGGITGALLAGSGGRIEGGQKGIKFGVPVGTAFGLCAFTLTSLSAYNSGVNSAIKHGPVLPLAFNLGLEAALVKAGSAVPPLLGYAEIGGIAGGVAAGILTKESVKRRNYLSQLNRNELNR